MLDYIGSHVVSVTKTPSGHNVTLQLQGSEDDGLIGRQFHVRGLSPGELGDRLVVMVLEDEVAGWHNQATGEQAHLLHALRRLRWRLRDLGIAVAVASVPCLFSRPLLGLASSLGWFVSTALWRLWAMRDIRGELVTALQLAAGVSAKKD